MNVFSTCSKYLASLSIRVSERSSGKADKQARSEQVSSVRSRHTKVIVQQIHGCMHLDSCRADQFEAFWQYLRKAIHNSLRGAIVRPDE